MSLNKELRYGSKLHQRVKEAIIAREKLSRDAMRDKESDWEEAEDLSLAYVPEKEMDAKRRSKREGGDPQYTTIEVPQSMAMLLAGHTYWTSVMLGRNPVFQFSGRHGEPESAKLALEALIDYQVHVGCMVAPMYVWLFDVGRYGLGVVGRYWEEEQIQQVKYEEVPVEYLGIPLAGQTKKVRNETTIPGYVGNRLFNVRPYDWRPDPRVPMREFQRGEFCGRVVDEGYNALIAGQQEGRYYQVKYVKKSNRQEYYDRGGSSQLDLPLDDARDVPLFLPNEVGFTELIEMDIELIPRDWRLADSNKLELWHFTLADREVIIESRPSINPHERYPYDVLLYEFEGYARVGRGMLEVLKPLNDVLSWLFNSHMYNVRGSLNNNLVVDPNRVVMKDVTSESPNKTIRLKEAAYGTDIRSAIMQLQVGDVTQGHLRDGQIVMDMMQRLVGIMDNMQGMVNQGGRKTATEVRSANTFGINRQKTLTEWWSATGFGTLPRGLVQTTQMNYDMQRQYKIAGDLITWAPGETVNVGPEDIAGFFDFVPVDGTLPVDRFAQSNLWKEILVGLQKMPQIAQQYDLGKVFEWMAQLAGLKNIREFRVSVVPDAQARTGAQAGNIVPAPVPRSRQTLDRAGEPGQVPGMGSTL